MGRVDGCGCAGRVAGRAGVVVIVDGAGRATEPLTLGRATEPDPTEGRLGDVPTEGRATLPDPGDTPGRGLDIPGRMEPELPG